MSKQAKFNIGDIVIHKQQGYRAVIIDVDPLFQASGRYNPGVVNREFANKNPWYRLLVDDSNQMTYVEEPLLVGDEHLQVIENPQIEGYLTMRNGKYCKNTRCH